MSANGSAVRSSPCSLLSCALRQAGFITGWTGMNRKRMRPD